MDKRAEELIPQIESCLKRGPRSHLWLYAALNLDRSDLLWEALDEMQAKGRVKLDEREENYELVA